MDYDISNFTASDINHFNFGDCVDSAEILKGGAGYDWKCLYEKGVFKIEGMYWKLGILLIITPIITFLASIILTKIAIRISDYKNRQVLLWMASNAHIFDSVISFVCGTMFVYGYIKTHP